MKEAKTFYEQLGGTYRETSFPNAELPEQNGIIHIVRLKNPKRIISGCLNFAFETATCVFFYLAIKIKFPRLHSRQQALYFLPFGKVCNRHFSHSELSATVRIKLNGKGLVKRLL